MNPDDLKFRIRWDWHRDANQGLVEELTVSIAPRRDRRDVGAGTIGAVIRAEDRIRALSTVKFFALRPRG